MHEGSPKPTQRLHLISVGRAGLPIIGLGITHQGVILILVATRIGRTALLKNNHPLDRVSSPFSQLQGGSPLWVKRWNEDFDVVSR